MSARESRLAEQYSSSLEGKEQLIEYAQSVLLWNKQIDLVVIIVLLNVALWYFFLDFKLALSFFSYFSHFNFFYILLQCFQGFLPLGHQLVQLVWGEVLCLGHLI